MKFKKFSNDVVYIDFTHKDYMELVSEYRPEIYKVSIVICNLFWLPMTIYNVIKLIQLKDEVRPDLKVVVYTGISRYDYYSMGCRINKIIRLSIPKPWRKRIKLHGGSLDFVSNGYQYYIYRENWSIHVEMVNPISRYQITFAIQEDVYPSIRDRSIIHSRYYSYMMNKHNEFLEAAVKNVGYDITSVYDRYIDIMLDTLTAIENKKPGEIFYGLDDDGKPIIFQPGTD